jgi:hypothetical protein
VFNRGSELTSLWLAAEKAAVSDDGDADIATTNPDDHEAPRPFPRARGGGGPAAGDGKSPLKVRYIF